MIAVVPTLLPAELMEQRIAVAVVLLLHITVEALQLLGVIHHRIIVVVAVLLLIPVILQVVLQQVPATLRVSLHRLVRVVTQVVVEVPALAVLLVVEVEEDNNDWYFNKIYL